MALPPDSGDDEESWEEICLLTQKRVLMCRIKTSKHTAHNCVRSDLCCSHTWNRGLLQASRRGFPGSSGALRPTLPSGRCSPRDALVRGCPIRSSDGPCASKAQGHPLAMRRQSSWVLRPSALGVGRAGHCPLRRAFLGSHTNSCVSLQSTVLAQTGR